LSLSKREILFNRIVLFQLEHFGEHSLGDGERDGSVGIATCYGLDGPGIETSWGGEIYRTRPDRPWGPPSFLFNAYRFFPGGKAAGAWL